MKKKFHRVTFLPEQKTVKVEDRLTIFETILENNPHNIQLNFACGAEGICQKCKIRAFQKMGPLTPIEKGCLTQDEITRGIRLACQARVIQDTAVEIMYKMPFSIVLTDEILSSEAELRPRVSKLHITAQGGEYLSLNECMHSVQVYTDRVGEQQKHAGFENRFAHFFERNLTECTAVFIDGALVCLEDGDTTRSIFAVAVDLGINTLMASLIDLRTGRKCATVTDTNPQIHMGADFETRIAMVDQDALNLEILHEDILLRIDILILELCRARNLLPIHVYEVIITGTTGMLHLFLKGVPGFMEQQSLLGKETKSSFSAKQLHFQSSQRARIHSFPVISSYVGADITAGILATQLHRSQETVLFLDLGTQVKAVCHHNNTIVATSIPEGSAFECAGIAFGMRPESGAIDRVTIDTHINISVIGKSLPRGICGSGLMELTAELKRVGILDNQGNFQDPACLENLGPGVVKSIIQRHGTQAVRLYTDEGEFQTDIYVTQDTFYSLRRAKAWTAALVEQVTAYLGIDLRVVAKVLIGGAFGHRFAIAALFELGLLPQFLKEKTFFVGNTAVQGAQVALLHQTVLDEAERLVADVICLPPLQGEIAQRYLHFSS